MSTKATGNKKHLTLADRAAIEHGISCGENFTQIAHRINKDSSTISKEIRRHLFRVPHFQNETQRKRSECEHYQNCEKQHICGNQTCNSLCWKCRPKRCSMYCPDFTPSLCDRLKKPPYVCNDCPQIRSCSHDFYFYRANYANDIYSETKSSSRSGINQTPESLEQLDRLVSPLLLQGQPLSHIFASNQDSVSCSIRTLYNYIDQGYLTAINLDLPVKSATKSAGRPAGSPTTLGIEKAGPIRILSGIWKSFQIQMWWN